MDNMEKLNDNIVTSAALLITTLHEFFHMLRRAIIKRAASPVYERTPPRIVRSRQNTLLSEGGAQLEDHLFGTVINGVGYFDGSFIVGVQNWRDNNHKEFKQKFLGMQARDLEVSTKQNRWIILLQVELYSPYTVLYCENTASYMVPYYCAQDYEKIQFVHGTV
jgi:hypothetical protein